MTRFSGIVAVSILLASPCRASHTEIQYEYDDLGRLHSVTYPSTQTKIAYTLDAEGNRIRVEVTGAAPAARRHDSRAGEEAAGAGLGGDANSAATSAGSVSGAAPATPGATKSASPVVTVTPTPTEAPPTASPTPTPMPVSARLDF